MTETDQCGFETIEECQNLVGWMFIKIMQIHGAVAARKIFAPYGGHKTQIARAKRVSKDADFLLQFLKSGLSQEKFAEKKAGENGKDSKSELRRLQRLLHDPASHYDIVRMTVEAMLTEIKV